MKILPHHYYDLIMRTGDAYREGRCFDLRVRKLSSEESSDYASLFGRETIQLAHEVAFRDVEHIRAYIGWIKEDSENKMVFAMEGEKEYEFRPLSLPDIDS